MLVLSRLFITGILCLAAWLSLPAAAGAASPAESVERTLAAARQQLDGIQKGMDDRTPDDRLVALRNAALGLQSRAEALATELGPELAKVEARVAELGAAPPSGEAADVAEQRAALDRQRGQIDAQMKLARLIGVESGQVVERILAMRRARLQARLFERTESMLSPGFWEDFAASAPRDGRRLGALAVQLREASVATPARIWAGLVLGAVGVLMLFVRTRSALLHLSSTRVPAGRLRRSAFATANTVLPTVAGLIVATLLALGPGWNTPLSASQQALVELIATVGVLATFIASLGYALLSPRRPSWRLPPLSDRCAAYLRRDPLLLGCTFGLVVVIEQLVTLANLSLATTVAVNSLVALALGLVVIRLLLRVRALRRETFAPAADGTAPPPAWPWWWSLLVGLGWALTLFSLACVVIGFVALGSLVVKQGVWVCVIIAAAYLLDALVDDLFVGLLAGGQGPATEPGQLRAQVAVLMSGGCRVVIAMMALVLILAPFGEAPGDLLTRAGAAGDGVAIGEIQLRPGVVAQAMVVLALGLVAVRVMQRWLADRFLPTTRIDPGMRSSVTTLLGWLGVIAAVSLALSAVGLGLERIAWVASALSVGIGFGLQAVVSNFVSGLILLAERPVKVGDWVSLGGVEGDIRRINVRATEIQMGDRSTVIVPNSEFITKTVRNLTMANPLGLVSIKLPMPLDTDVEQVRSLVLAAFAAHPEVLDTPPPAVHLDGIDGANLIFAASGSVSSPRRAYGVKSALLFDILKRLREARLPMGKSPTMVLQAAAPPAG